MRIVLTVAAVCLGLTSAQPAGASPVDRWSVPIREASARFGIPVAWIERVMAAESGGRTTLGGRPVRSSAGAMGLMQLMPGTWSEMRARHGLGPDPDEPRDNILAGTAYLRLMYDRFGYPGLFAAYNAGPARFANHLATGRRLPAETVAYVAKVAAGSVERLPTAPPLTPALLAPSLTFGADRSRTAANTSDVMAAHIEAPPRPPALFVVHRPPTPQAGVDARDGSAPELAQPEPGPLFVRLGLAAATR